MGFTNLIDKVQSLIEPVILEAGFDLWGLEYLNISGKTLRIYIDKKGGVVVEDCALISGLVNRILDVYDLIAEEYKLEVSSPGVNRKFFKSNQYAGFIGEQIKIKTLKDIEGVKNFKGVLKNTNNEFLEIEVDDKVWQVPYTFIGNARLVF